MTRRADLVEDHRPGPAPALHPQIWLEKYLPTGSLAEAWFHSLVIESELCSSGSWSSLHEGEIWALVPDGFSIRATNSGDRGITSVLATAADAVALLERQSDSKVRVQLAAPSAADVQRWRSVIDSQCTVAEIPDVVAAEFWALGRHGAASERRSFDAVNFSDIRRNYDSAARAQLEELSAFGAQRNRGGLIVWFGPPGTGKTTAVRAMATGWEADRELNVITDIEQFLQNADYLAEVTRSHERSDRRGERAKLIVAEDVDPALLAEQQASGSGGLARLLALTDGLLASATDAIVLLTTNAKRHQIAPSLQRPGRCLALVDLGPLSASDANAWLPPGVPRVTEPTTLAELYHRAGLVHRISAMDGRSSTGGTYL